jgi:arylsulfatase A-like enzyme
MGDHGLLNKGPLHYRSLIRTPLIWADPAGVQGDRSARLCSSIDLAPTILARAGVTAYRGMQGRPLLDESKASTGPMATRDAVLIEEDTHHRYPGSPFPLRVRSLVTDCWRLSVRGDEVWGELYDLESDPGERHNRWADPTAAAVKSELMFRLVQEMQRHVDDAPQPLRMA